MSVHPVRSGVGPSSRTVQLEVDAELAERIDSAARDGYRSFEDQCRMMLATWRGPRRRAAEPEAPRLAPEEAEARRDQMVALYHQGLTLQEIGDQHELTRERVRQILLGHVDHAVHEAALSQRAVPARSDVSPAQDARAYELYRQIGAHGAARQLIVSPVRVIRMLKRHSMRTGDPYPLSRRVCDPEAAYAVLERRGNWEAATEAGGYSSKGSAYQSVARWALERGRPWPLKQPRKARKRRVPVSASDEG